MHFDKNQLYTFIDKFDKKKISNFKNIKNVIFRNYKKKIDLKTIIKIKKECKNKQLKFYLSNDIRLALKANLDGVYIPSFNTSLNLNNFRNKKKNFKVLGSAHNLREIKFKERQGVEIIFLSPLFLTKNYKSNLGIVKFNLISRKSKKSLIALGGIRKNNQNQLKMINAKGYSGITIFN